ncbi:endonuclease/exonuclease/phosphatase family protein [Ensifer sp. ENS07]|jgi:endonuclease/exonuclease/phosphatase family metal-dependent hydrolase|uniref:Endonuclease/exonuclease/phosphatase family protein n=1 Tax=Ensifer adhaerens TaxID=106592 RepID=A0A9Q9DB19_ENSAD|nr:MULTISPECIES: endonuclease/exonuclease/phosphatase family protein [Ensifer]MBD9594215.1 endonuclease/exonuclease/phosphatase family protein [Ensifer sp. ENS05]MBD9635843.1 endonuclease/exonuclease/phosphatase family protein [Ensifer sp. ENS07]USJ24611.1 endonuclease/exonuclease/phosphatase family protein [Ensifer adhaerens]UTV37995.1 endonuclease/exonuclease/phosphatase family protein [Ensifer adhaerens]SDM02859.1 Metal-dependent hydrolase, endonuclease/exonuclease/phosphatase family [Ensif
MRILSLNAWGGKLHSPLMKYLADVDADVLCLQEVARSPTTEAEWLSYRDADVELPQRANLFDEIAAVLPGHDGFFCPTARGTLFSGDTPVASEFGLATFVRRGYSVIGQALGFVHGSFSPDSWGPHPRARNAHCIRLFDHDAGTPITIAQMHGLREVGGKNDSPARRAQAEALVGLVHQVWPGDERLVVCGDFNVLPDSQTFQTLGQLGLVDLVVSRGHTDTRTSHYLKSGRFADYMLANGAVSVARFDVVAEPEVSDHRALLLDIA